jgi:electron transport complex protein RnfG
MKKYLSNILVLVCICAVVSVILSVTNALTAPKIEANEKEKTRKALLQVMPDGVSFEPVDISAETLPSTVREVYRAENGGYVIKLSTTGYSTGFVIMCGIRTDGTVSGAVCLSSTETLGYEKTYGQSFLDKNKEEVEGVDTIAGATKTTAAYRSAVKDALNAALILYGHDVDIRTEEEILRDNLSAALPSANGEFEKRFLTEKLVGVDAVYEAKNKSGFVFLMGEQFIGLDETGKVISETAEDVAATAKTASALLLASQTSPISLSSYAGLPTSLTSAEKTATGNYVLELKAAGYGIYGTRKPSGEYITIRVSLTSDGTVIDCLTLSQAETEGVGSVCAEESFYGQFRGKTEDTYTQIDAISRATITTDGYKKAILDAFTSVRIFEKGATP